jgi:cytochrome oxidase assembly protein ShyY1
MLRFLLRPRWIAFALFTMLLSALFVRLGFWQLDRLQGRRYYNQRFEHGMAAPPEPAESLIDHADGADLLYRNASASGRYDPAHEVILYGRTQDGSPGNHVLTPLILGDGRALLVDRGWVPIADDTPPVAGAAPPTGKVEVTGLLAPSEPGGAPGGGTTTTFTRVDLRRIGAQLPYGLLPDYLQLQHQSPPQSGALPIHPPPPVLDDGPHLSYAIQWFSFATIAFFGFFLLVAREARSERRASELPSDVHPADASGSI